MVAHELRSPIGGAQSLLRTLLAGMTGDLTPQQESILGRVEVRLESLKTLVEDLLLLAAAKNLPVSHELDTIDLTQVITAVVDHYDVEAKDQGVVLHLYRPAYSVHALGTRDGYVKIFSNLVANAIK